MKRNIMYSRASTCIFQMENSNLLFAVSIGEFDGNNVINFHPKEEKTQQTLVGMLLKKAQIVQSETLISLTHTHAQPPRKDYQNRFGSASGPTALSSVGSDIRVSGELLGIKQTFHSLWCLLQWRGGSELSDKDL